MKIATICAYAGYVDPDTGRERRYLWNMPLQARTLKLMKDTLPDRIRATDLDCRAIAGDLLLDLVEVEYTILSVASSLSRLQSRVATNRTRPNIAIVKQ